MGMTLTPDGQVVYLPDNLTGSPVGAPAAVPPVPAPPGGAAPPSPDVPLHPNVLAYLGVNPPIQSPAVEQPPAKAPVQNAPDYSLGTLDVPSTMQGVQASNKAFDKQQLAQAAYNASPEGQIQSAQGEQQAALGQAADILHSQTDLEQAKQEELKPIQDQGRADIEAMRTRQAQEQAHYQSGLDATSKDIDEQVDKWRSYSVNKNKFWEDIGPGRSAMAWVFAGLSSLGDALQHKSGPNLAVQMITDAVDKHVALQLKERESLKEGIGIARDRLATFRQRYGDWKDAAAVEKSTILEQVADKVKATADKYAGAEAKLRGAAMENELRQRAATLRSGAAESSWNRSYQGEQLANQKRQTSISAGHLALAGKQFKEGQYQFDKTQELQAAQLDAGKGAAGAKAAQELAVGDYKLGQDAPPVMVTDAKGDPVLDAQGKPQLKIEPLRQPDGSAWQAPNEKRADLLATKRAAVDKLMPIYDRIAQIREEVGGESGLLNSKYRQELDTLQANILMITKEPTNGMNSEGDMDRLLEAAGAKDVASFRDQSAKIAVGRQKAQDLYNSDMRALGRYRGPKIEWPKPPPPTTTESSAKQRDRILQGGELRDLENVPGTPANTIRQLTDPAYREQVEAARVQGLLPGQAQIVNNYAAQLKDPQTAKRAQAEVGQIINDPAIRPEVKAALRAVLAADVTGGGK